MSRLALVGALGLAACFSSNATTCPDGTVCPEKKVCAPAGGTCVDPEQIDACSGIAEGSGCTLASVGHGVCQGGICVSAGGCGDGIVEAGEACDDGNTTSGDGCRSDCHKIEMCGDGILDDGEACDDANQDPSDGCDACHLTEWTATPLVGGDVLALSTPFVGAGRIVVDRSGNVYIADSGSSRVFRLDPTSGAIVVVAGNGSSGFSGDGGPATDAQLQAINGLAVDGLGNLFIADGLRVRRVDAVTGIITTYAGNGSFDPLPGGTGDNGPATIAPIRADDVAVDGLGFLYIAEDHNQLVRRVDPTTGIITTFAGGGSDTSDGIAATSALLTGAHSLATDTANDVYIGMIDMVREVSASDGTITTVAGTGNSTAPDSGDGGPAIAADFGSNPIIALDGASNLYIAELDPSPGHSRVRRVDAATGTIETIAGTGQFGDTGDGGLATAATLANPSGIAVDAVNDVWIAEQGDSVVREINPATGVIARRAGAPGGGFDSQGELPTSVKLDVPTGVAIDPQGRPAIAVDGQIVRFDAAGPTVIVGSGNLSFSGGIAYDASGNLFIADAARVLRVDAVTGAITTIAGTGQFGYTGDGGPATLAQLESPVAVAVDTGGNVYVADEDAHVVRRVASDGTISTFAGIGLAGYTGDGVAATSTRLYRPQGVAVDGAGNVYIADTSNNRIRRVDMNGTISTFAGDGNPGFSGDGGLATLAEVSYPTDVFVDATGRVYIADTDNGRIRRVDTNGTITTTAGALNGGFAGDLGLASDARIGIVTRGAIDAQGTMYLIEQPDTVQGSHLRRIDASGVITTLAGLVEPDGMGPIAHAHAADPGAMAVTPAGLLIAGGSSGTVQRLGTMTLDVVAGRYLQDLPTGLLARYRDQFYPAIGGLAYDATSSTLYVTAGNEIDAISLVDPANPDTWTIRMLAGGAPGYAEGATALFTGPTGLALDGTMLYVADTGNHVIRAVDTQSGRSMLVAGTPRTLGYAGDGGSPTAALFNAPTAVAKCAGGLYVADTSNNRVRRIANGTVTTVLGDGVPGSSGQGSPSALFSVDEPRGLACDALGNVFVTSTNSVRALAADSSGVVDGTGLVETIYGAPPRTTFPQTVTRCLAGIVVIDAQTVRISDSCTGMVIDLVRTAKP